MATKWLPGARSTHLGRRVWLRDSQLQLPEYPPLYLKRQKIAKVVQDKEWDLDVLDGRRYSSQIPGYFGLMSEMVLTAIAGGAAFSGADYQKGATLASVQPTPYEYSNSHGKNGIIIPWCGAVSAPDLGLYLKAAEGGHGDGWDNAIYALDARLEVPGWARWWGPTPVEDISASPLGSGSGGGADANNAFAHVVNDDGAPKTSHGWFRRLWAANRLWLLMTNEGGGAWTTDVWSIARADLGPGNYDPSKWIYHGRSWPTFSGSFGFQSGPSAYDAVGNQIIIAAEFAEEDGVKTINCATAIAAGAQSTAGNAVPGTTTYDVGFTGLGNAWSFVTDTSPRCWIVGSPANDNILVWNLSSPAGFREKTVGGSLDIADTVFCGAGYYKGAGVIGGPPSLTTELAKLSLPADPWNDESGFALSSMPFTGTMEAVEDYQGTFSQYQLIPDMGNGQGMVLLHSRDTSLPTYALKLPESI